MVDAMVIFIFRGKPEESSFKSVEKNNIQKGHIRIQLTDHTIVVLIEQNPCMQGH